MFPAKGLVLSVMVLWYAAYAFAGSGRPSYCDMWQFAPANVRESTMRTLEFNQTLQEILGASARLRLASTEFTQTVGLVAALRARTAVPLHLSTAAIEPVESPTNYVLSEVAEGHSEPPNAHDPNQDREGQSEQIRKLLELEKKLKSEAAAKQARTENASLTAAENALNKMRALAGVWTMPDADSDGKPDGAVIYRLTGNGSAVVETLMPGTPHEMATVYHLDGPTLVATHYCAMGNQPKMRARPDPEKPHVIRFEFESVSNLRSPDEAHIHDLTYTFIDADHVEAAWQSYQDQKPSAESPTFKLTRVKDKDEARRIMEAMWESN